MKQLFKPLAVLFCLTVVFSCSKTTNGVITDVAVVNPISDYTITPDPADGFTFKYTNLSKNYTKLEWRFGDDTLKTDANPSHVFLATGKYTTDLKTFSTTGNVSHKYVDINIAPDDVLQISTAKTGVTGQIQFGIVVKGNVKTASWTIIDVANSTAPKTVKFNTINPIYTFAIGSFNTVAVTITTDKGSIATISKYVTTEGLVTDITQSRLNYTSSLENGGNPANANGNEGSSKLIDGNLATKFGVYNPNFVPPWVYTLNFAAQVTVKVYSIANANDQKNDRDPKEWYFEASNDGINWVVLDHIVQAKGFYDQGTALGITDDQLHYKRYWYFPIKTPGAYSSYRLRIMSSFIGNALQLAEFNLFK